MFNNLRIFYRTDPRIRFCPGCDNQGTLKKSHSRGIIEKFVKTITPLSKFRCRECGWRGYKSAYVLRLSSLKAIIFYVLLFLSAAVIVSFILRRFILK